MVLCGEMYWLQHGLMLVVPVVLAGQEVRPEHWSDLSHATLSYSVFFLYHIVLLQPVARYTGINLDYTLCPAPSDPFSGPRYILHALWSQAVVIAFLTRTYILLISYIVPAKLDLVKSK